MGDPEARRRWICRGSVMVVLPALLVALESVSARTQLKFLLFPPVAAIGFRMFREPGSRAANWRSAIAAPVLASVAGLALSRAGGLSAWTTATATVTGIVLVELLDADAPPALAVVLLALFARPTWVFPVSVLAATAGLYAIFAVWRAGMNRLAVG